MGENLGLCIISISGYEWLHLSLRKQVGEDGVEGREWGKLKCLDLDIMNLRSL